MRVWRERRRHRKVKERKITFGHVHVLYNFQLCCSSHLPLFLFNISDAVKDQTTLPLHLDTTPHIQHASVNKLTLWDLTQQTKNSRRRGQQQQQHG